MYSKKFSYSHNDNNSLLVRLDCPSQFELACGDTKEEYIVMVSELKEGENIVSQASFNSYAQANMMFRGLVTGYLMINPI